MTATLGRSPTFRELEASVEAYFTKMVRLMGGFTVKLAPTQKGVPDRLVFMPGGRMMLVELKADGGRLSEAQIFWHERVRALGIPVYVVTGHSGVDAFARAGGGMFSGERTDSPAPRDRKKRSRR